MRDLYWNNARTMSWHGTTIVAARDPRGRAAIGSDGQVTVGQLVMKSTATKVRRLFKDQVLAGFAGATADALTLFDLFETELSKSHGSLPRAAVELTKRWRTDRSLRHLEAMLLVVDRKDLLVLSGSGDALAPDDPFAAIGSGGPYATAALKALQLDPSLSAVQRVQTALEIAASLCIYTNDKIQMLELE